MSKVASRLERENWEYYNGNQFGYWIGTMPSKNDPNRDSIIQELERIFICANLIKECIDRHLDALLGDTPRFFVKPKASASDEDAQSNLEAEKQLKEWLDTLANMAYQDVDEDIHPINQAVLGMLVTGKAYLRLFSRRRFQNSPNLYQRVSLHCPANEQIKMYYDDEGSLEAIEYLFSDERIERQELDYGTGILHFKIYENEAEKEKDNPAEEYDIDLGYNWTIFELKAPPLVTNSVKRQQNAINLALTMCGRNVVTAGFLERVLLNAQTPGDFIEKENGDLEFIPDPRGYATGAGAVAIVKGLPIGDDPLNPEGYTSPQAVFREPVSVQTFEDSLRIYVTRLYHEFGQGHILAQGDGNISGVSRIQLAHDFQNTVKKQKEVIEAVLNNVFYTTLEMLTAITGGTRYKDQVVQTELKLSAHILTAEEHQQIREDFKAGILSLETTLSYIGVDDVPAELERVEAERQQRMEEMQVSLDTLTPPSSPSLNT